MIEGSDRGQGLTVVVVGIHVDVRDLPAAHGSVQTPAVARVSVLSHCQRQNGTTVHTHNYTKSSYYTQKHTKACDSCNKRVCMRASRMGARASGLRAPVGSEGVDGFNVQRCISVEAKTNISLHIITQCYSKLPDPIQFLSHSWACIHKAS